MIHLNTSHDLFDLELEIACSLPIRKKGRSYFPAREDDLCEDFDLSPKELRDRIDGLNKRAFHVERLEKKGKIKYVLRHSESSMTYLRESYLDKVYGCAH